MTTPLAHHVAIQRGFARMRRDGKAGHRDIASELGISEGQRVAAHVTLPDESPERPKTHRRRFGELARVVRRARQDHLRLVADTVARTLAIPAKISVGTSTASIGGPGFLLRLRGVSPQQGGPA